MSLGQGVIWDDLLEYIDDSRVIPIIGWDLLRVDVAGTPVRLDRLVASRLAQRLGLPAPTDTEDDPLNDLVCRFKSNGGHADQLYSRLRSVLKDRFPTPEPLRQIARIRHFRYFVTTTFDTLLEQALDEERGRGARGTRSAAYSLSKQEDLPAAAATESSPVVYHLLGRSESTVPDCVLSQEHTLEYFHHLQRQGVPDQLADLLHRNHLLLIGNRLSDWLVRFLIRIAKGERLDTSRGCSQIVADPAAVHNDELVRFLRSFSPSTYVCDEGDAVGFVAELSRRYAERHGNTEAAPERSVQPTDEGPAMPEGATFISYASEDLPAAQHLHAGLEAAGIDAWFDKRRLEAGDEFDAKIGRSIRNCSLFIPLISATTQRRVEGYFRQEWNLAAERAMRMDESVRFILPVVVDDTREDESARVPDRFRRLHWTRLPNGRCDPAFIDQVKNLVREAHRRQRAPR